VTLLLCEGLKRHFGAHEVLRGASLRIDRGDKLGLVGRNGGGKSTLLRILAGEDAPDEGSLVRPKGVRIGHVPQAPTFEPGVIAFDHVEHGLDEPRALAAELARIEGELGDAAGVALERLVARHGELTQAMELLGGWQSEQIVETVLSGIGLDPGLWRREARTLSGGEKSRVALARELVRRPDVLLLDEPTNHLDLDGIEWLESYLGALSSSVLFVSHDRRLLDRVATAVLELERGKLERYPGNYTRYVALRRERHASELRAYEVQQDFLRKEESFIRKHMGSQRTAEAKGRQKKLEHVVRLEKPHDDVRKPVIRIPDVARGGEMVLHAEGLAIGFQDRVLHRGIDLRIGRGERIGLVGPNGAGKTTLLQVLAGRRAPLAGELRRGHGAVCGYYDQETADLDPEGTPLSLMRKDRPLATEQELRSHLAMFLFRGEEVDLPVASLSGGERARLTLARLVLTAPSWLALDEPTNHLDLAARTALEEMLSGFPGAILCISHDREFLDNLATRIVEISPERGIRSFEGNYSDWRRRIAEERETRPARKEPARPVQAPAAEPAKPKEAAKERGSKIRNPYLFQKLEQEIIALEEERSRLQAEMTEERVWRDATLMREIEMRLAELERDLEAKNETWANWA
jgi:ATP-binding cassette, subfamily F, member 3